MSFRKLRRRGRARGFTLFEVVVAAAILAFGLTALYGAFSQSLNGLARSGAAERATLLARSKLAEVGSLLPLSPGVTAGEAADGSRWSLEIGPFGDTAGAGLTPYRVRVTIEAEGHRTVLETIRNGRAAGP